MTMTLRAARIIRGLSREEAAERIGVAASTIGNYERGTSFPNVPVLRRIEEVYGVAYENLVFQTAAPDPSQP